MTEGIPHFICFCVMIPNAEMSSSTHYLHEHLQCRFFEVITMWKMTFNLQIFLCNSHTASYRRCRNFTRSSCTDSRQFSKEWLHYTCTMWVHPKRIINLITPARCTLCAAQKIFVLLSLIICANINTAHYILNFREEKQAFIFCL